MEKEQINNERTCLFKENSELKKVITNLQIQLE